MPRPVECSMTVPEMSMALPLVPANDEAFRSTVTVVHDAVHRLREGGVRRPEARGSEAELREEGARPLIGALQREVVRSGDERHDVPRHIDLRAHPNAWVRIHVDRDAEPDPAGRQE